MSDGCISSEFAQQVILVAFFCGGVIGALAMAAVSFAALAVKRKNHPHDR